MVIQPMFRPLGGGPASLGWELNVEIILARAAAGDTNVSGKCGVERLGDSEEVGTD